MGGSVGGMANGWPHGARVSVAWVWEGLELHGLAGVHLLAESKKVEGSVGADLVFHA